jgi:1-acyl-sn-glycerol-3-phosphate acyltransferase
MHKYWKIAVIGFLMFVHLIVGNAARLFLHGHRLRNFQNRLVQRMGKLGIAVLGVKVEIENEHNARAGQNYLIVSNHLSYLDILVYASWKPICFVSTVEVQRTPLLGQLTSAAGCIFVERRNRDNIKNEVDAVGKVLGEGFNLNFFPEGTSTNGTSVLPFKRPFFAPSLTAQVPVLPCVLQYTEINGETVTSANRDYICYYGDMQFAPHLLALASRSTIKVKINVLPEIGVTPTTERETLVQAAQTAIHTAYKPIPEKA